MSKHPKNLSGTYFGKIYIIRKADDNECTPEQNFSDESKWVCYCSCNPSITFVVRRSDLIRGKINCCQDYYRLEDERKKRGSGDNRIKHIWDAMKARCYSKKHKHYKSYGGRGITICDEWLNSFDNFYRWALLNGYSNNLTIERIDNDKPYEPNNCKFIMSVEQQQNKRNVIKCDSGLSLRAECRIQGVPYSSVRAKIKTGLSIEEAIEAVKKI